MCLNFLADKGTFCFAFFRVDSAELAALLHFQNAIERHPAHQSRMGVRPSFVSIFPNSVVRLAPMFADIFGALTQHLLRVAIEIFLFANEMRNGFDHFSVEIELHLLARGIADAHRTRTSVSMKMRQIALSQRAFAKNIV